MYSSIYRNIFEAIMRKYINRARIQDTNQYVFWSTYGFSDTTISSAPAQPSPTSATATFTLSSVLPLTEYISLISSDGTTKKYIPTTTAGISNGHSLQSTISFTFISVLSQQQSISLISSDNTIKKYIYNNFSTTGNVGSAGDVYFTGSSVADCAAQLKIAIEHTNGHNGKLVVAVDGSGGITITQQTGNSTGDTLISVSSSFNNSTNPNPPSSFSGGGIAFIAGSTTSEAASNISAAVNSANGHQSKITASNTGSQVTLTQNTTGHSGNKNITTSTNFNNYCSVNPPSAFSGGTGPFTLIEHVVIARQSSDNISKKENLTSQINGSATVFTTSKSYVPGSLVVYWNGLRQINPTTFSETTSTTFTLSDTPEIGSYIEVEYHQQ
tara:strand:- start:13542 stop:14693 length:1152 start_codon:yes stop_codon:yes gene_type:complete